MEENLFKQRKEKDFAVLLKSFEPIRQKEISIIENNIPIYEQNAKYYKGYIDSFVGKIESLKRFINEKQSQIKETKGIFGLGTRQKLSKEIILMERDIKETEGWIKDYTQKYEKALEDKTYEEERIKILKGELTYDFVYKEMLKREDVYAKMIYVRDLYFSRVKSNQKYYNSGDKELKNCLEFVSPLAYKGNVEASFFKIGIETRTDSMYGAEYRREWLLSLKQHIEENFPEYVEESKYLEEDLAFTIKYLKQKAEEYKEQQERIPFGGYGSARSYNSHVNLNMWGINREDDDESLTPLEREEIKLDKRIWCD